MPRSLSVARVRVPADHEAEWLDVAAQLAALLKQRGQHVWVFRSEADPERWIEFSESGDRPDHRSVAAATPSCPSTSTATYRETCSPTADSALAYVVYIPGIHTGGRGR